MGNYSNEDIRHMPTEERLWFLKRLDSQKQKEKKEMDKANKR